MDKLSQVAKMQNSNQKFNSNVRERNGSEKAVRGGFQQRRKSVMLQIMQHSNFKKIHILTINKISIQQILLIFNRNYENACNII